VGRHVFNAADGMLLFILYRNLAGWAIAALCASNTSTTNGHWAKTELDGFGRTVHSITGYGTGTGMLAII
jgi:hypothetical protein